MKPVADLAAELLAALHGSADPRHLPVESALRARASGLRGIEDLRQATLDAVPRAEAVRRTQIEEIFQQETAGFELGLVAGLRGDS